MSLLGRYLDNKLQEHDDKGRPKYQLAALLADVPQPGATVAKPRGKYRSIGRTRDL